MEKKILWMTGVTLCANKVTWALVAAEASRVAKNCGEKPVTDEVSQAGVTLRNRWNTHAEL